MDRLTIVVALLVSSLATAGGGLSNKNTIGFSGARPSPVVLDTGAMATCGTIATGTVMPKGGALTVTRNATENYVCADGVMRSAAVNTLGVLEGGAQVYGAYTANPPYSDTFANAAWTKDAVPGATDASASCPYGPNGVTRMSLIDATTSGTGTGLLQDVASTTERNVFLALATGDSACTVTVSDAAGSGGEAVTMTATAVRYTKYVAAQHGLKVVATTCTRFCMWGANVTATLVAMPYVATGASPVAQPAMAVTAANPLAAGLLAYTINARANVYNWAASGYSLGSFGTYGSANAYLLTSTGPPLFVVFDSSAASRYMARSAPSAGEHAVKAGRRNGDVFFELDGSSAGGVSGGAGSGVSSIAPATFSIGPVGLLKRYILCSGARSYSDSRCQP